MATRKTTAEQIAETQEKIEQYENRMKGLLQKRKQQEQKARTHRLIERGAILESRLPGAATATNEQIKLFLDKTVKTEFANRVWREIAPPPAEPPAAEAAQGGGEAAGTQASPSAAQAAPNPAETPRSGGMGGAQNMGNGAGRAG